MNAQEIEKEIQAISLNAPRVTPVDIENEILSESYPIIVEPDGNGNDAIIHDTKFATGDYPVARVYESLKCLTICVLVLRNGFTVTGESACASSANFNAELGRKIARQRAVDKIWPLLGFRLRDSLSA